MVAIGVALGVMFVGFPIAIVLEVVIEKLVEHDTRPFRDILKDIL